MMPPDPVASWTMWPGRVWLRFKGSTVALERGAESEPLPLKLALLGPGDVARRPVV